MGRQFRPPERESTAPNHRMSGRLRHAKKIPAGIRWPQGPGAWLGWPGRRKSPAPGDFITPPSPTRTPKRAVPKVPKAPRARFTPDLLALLALWHPGPARGKSARLRKTVSPQPMRSRGILAGCPGSTYCPQVTQPDTRAAEPSKPANPRSVYSLLPNPAASEPLRISPTRDRTCRTSAVHSLRPTADGC